jgi:hypothetical protein
MKSIRTAEIIIAASIAAASFLFLVLGFAGGFAGGSTSAWISYYGHTLTGSLSSFLYVTILFLCLVMILLVVWSLGGGFLEIFFPKLRGVKRVLGGKTPLDIFIMAAKRSREMLLVIPAIFFITIVALAMGDANMFAPVRLQDVRVIGWEHAIFGNYVFAALGAVHYPHWLIVFIIFSFENMALFLIGAGILLAYVARKRFRELLVAFCIGIFAMVPLWLMLPVLSPQDRFIDNVYQLPMPPQIAAAVANYHPQQEIIDFLQKIRTGKVGLPALPTSTIPSAHIFWATLAGYYLFRAKKPWNIAGWITLPFLLASSFGTVLLAQHYFTDIPAGLAVAVLAIWLAHEIEKEEAVIDRL